MKFIHNITISVFSTDDIKQEFTQKMNEILPVDFVKEKLEVVQKNAEGVEQSTIHIYSFRVHKQRHTQMIMSALFEHINKQELERLHQQKEQRVDEEGNFYIRLDKDEFFQNNFYKVVDHGKCLHIRIKLAAYPKNKATAINVLDQLME